MEPLDESSYKLTILHSLYEYIYYEIVYWIKEYSFPRSCSHHIVCGRKIHCQTPIGV